GGTLPEPLGYRRIDKVPVPRKHRLQRPGNPDGKVVVDAGHEPEPGSIQGSQQWISGALSNDLNEQGALDRPLKLIPVPLEKFIKGRGIKGAVSHGGLESDENTNRVAVVEGQFAVFGSSALIPER